MRVRLPAEPAPLLELALALAQVQRRATDPVFAQWRMAARAALPRAASPLFDMVLPSGVGPLFLDPVSAAVDDGLDRVLATPAAAVQAQLASIKARPTPWLRGLAGGDRESWRLLEGAVRGAHRAVLERQWTRVRASVHADLAWRGQLLAQRGVHGMLTSLFPGTRWQGTTLEIASPLERDLHLHGRGVTLSPSPFWAGGPRFAADAAGGKMIVYPAFTPLPLVEAAVPADPLGALLGRTRAAMLRLLV